VIGFAYESGAGARTMTASLLGSMLVYWAAHVWSDAVGERIRSGAAAGPRVGFAAGRRAGGSRLTATVLAAGGRMLAILLLAAERLVQ
jgi:hypothetical protein